MDDITDDVHALEIISSEVDESQIKIILSSQCIKAQQFLLARLKTQTERYKETCSYISSANLKVETEIKQAEQEIRSMLLAQDTIKSANVEIKKEWLLAKHRKADITERVLEGKKKYEALWMECKTRFESIPFAQKLLEATENQKKIENDINDLDNQMTKLYDSMETKLKMCADINNKRAIELANFMITERPRAVTIIKEKSELIDKLTQEIELLLKEQKKDEVTVEVTEVSNTDDNIKTEEIEKNDDSNLSKTEDDILIPKLNLNHSFDLDNIDVNLDQVKIKKDEILNTVLTRTPMVSNIKKNVEQDNTYEYIISPFFKPYKEDSSRIFSERKLIHILEDINIDSGEVYNIVKKVNPEQLKPVGEISAETVENVKSTQNFTEDQHNRPKESENIEEVDLTGSSLNVESIIIPPTQFLDITLSDEQPRKRVSFDLPSMQINEIINADKQDDDGVNESENQTMNSQLDMSAASDESFMKIKEMLLKQHNLDLSPQFVYAKNNVLQMKNDDNVVTSKFFQRSNEHSNIIEQNDNEINVDEHISTKATEEISKPRKDKEEQIQNHPNDSILVPMDVDEVVSSPHLNKVGLKTFEEQKSEKLVTGFLFTHGAQEIPDSLNVSLSTTGYEESDFPHCIDSSVLLSPKADATAHGDNHNGLSQEVPHFLSGFRKTGLSFFGGPSTSADLKPDSSAQDHGNNFSFNFGGEKTNRGGLFSLFR